jgi:hypothetical protein
MRISSVPLDPLAQHEAMVPWELARVMARPQDQVIRLRDDDQFFMPFKVGHVSLPYGVQAYKNLFSKSSPSGRG